MNHEIRLAARRSAANMKETMLPVPCKTLASLYDGLSHHEEGRYKYLKDRKYSRPDERYSYPVQKSMEYGWKIGQEYDYVRPQFGRSCYESNALYRNNGVPTLSDPTKLGRRGFTVGSVDV